MDILDCDDSRVIERSHGNDRDSDIACAFADVATDRQDTFHHSTLASHDEFTLQVPRSRRQSPPVVARQADNFEAPAIIASSEAPMRKPPRTLDFDLAGRAWRAGLESGGASIEYQESDYTYPFAGKALILSIHLRDAERLGSQQRLRCVVSTPKMRGLRHTRAQQSVGRCNNSESEHCRPTQVRLACQSEAHEFAVP